MRNGQSGDVTDVCPEFLEWRGRGSTRKLGCCRSRKGPGGPVGGSTYVGAGLGSHSDFLPTCHGAELLLRESTSPVLLPILVIARRPFGEKEKESRSAGGLIAPLPRLSEDNTFKEVFQDLAPGHLPPPTLAIMFITV